MEGRVLAHDRITAPGAEPGRWLFVLHGIFGMGRNWGAIARRVVGARRDWGVELVDLREHGRSRGFAPPHTLAAAARDVRALAESLGVRTDAILGHSFGGKVALEYARRFPGAVEQLWIVDSTPEARPPSGSAVRMLESVRRHPGPFPSRGDAVRALESDGWATGVAQWMSTNLEPADGEYRWSLDFEAMQSLLDDFFATDLWGVVESPPAGLEIHVLRATRSDVLSAAAAGRIEAAARRSGRVHLHDVEGGHWLNADNPDAVVWLLQAELPPGPGAG
ncbi:MAG TPA: alpha/beta hydrolase [Longimicrobiales bacterium]